MKLNPLSLALCAASVLTVSLPVAAQTNQDFEQMRAEIRALRAELNAMKQAPAAAAAAAPAATLDRIEALEVKQKDNVVLGDIGGSIRLPGSETSVRVYGYIEANAIRDFKATAPGDNFTNLPEQQFNNSGATKGKTAMTAQTSRFGFETATPTAYGPVTTKLEADFYAYCGSECNRNRLRLRHAYAEYAGWTVGQTWSTFMDLDNLPETVDFNGPIGSTFRRPMQVRYTYNDPNVAKFQVAMEEPNSGGARPAFVVRADKSFDWGGINARLMSHQQVDGSGVKKNGKGYGFGGSYKLTGTLTAMGQFTQMDGDSDSAYLYGANYPAVGSAGGLLLDKSRGVVLGLTNNFDEKWRATVAYGLIKSAAKNGDDYAVSSSGNKKLSQLHIGTYYTPIKNVELGAEYILGKRTSYTMDTGSLSRVNLQARYSFN